MLNFGDIKSGDTVYCYFTQSDSDGARIAWDSTPDIAVFKDDDTTEILVADDAITLTESFDSKTGLTLIKIDISQGSSFVTGSQYTIEVHGTIDGQTVRAIVGMFTIEKFFPYCSQAEPAGDPDTWTFAQKLTWMVMRFLNKHTSDNFNGIKVYKEDGTLATTQAVTEAGGVKTVGKAQ